MYFVATELDQRESGCEFNLEEWNRAQHRPPKDSSQDCRMWNVHRLYMPRDVTSRGAAEHGDAQTEFELRRHGDLSQ